MNISATVRNSCYLAVIIIFVNFRVISALFTAQQPIECFIGRPQVAIKFLTVILVFYDAFIRAPDKCDVVKHRISGGLIGILTINCNGMNQSPLERFYIAANELPFVRIRLEVETVGNNNIAIVLSHIIGDIHAQAERTVRSRHLSGSLGKPGNHVCLGR